jgi:hypothetical protein
MTRAPSHRIPCGPAALALLCAFAAPLACAAPQHDDASGDTDEATTDDAQDGADVDRDDAPAPVFAGHDPSAAPRPRPRPIELVCAAYCDAYELSCGAVGGYRSVGECQDTCDDWPLGETGVIGATVGCHRAMLPSGGATGFASCIAAGPSSPICIDDRPSCARYCDDLVAGCGDDGGYEDLASCRAECVKLIPGTLGDERDSVGCRQHQAELALEDPRHCLAAGPDSRVCTGD